MKLFSTLAGTLWGVGILMWIGYSTLVHTEEDEQI